MEVKHIQRVEKQLGTARTVKVDEVIPQYREGVAKFLRDHQSLGDSWIEQTAKLLYHFQGRNAEGDLLGSSLYMLTAMSQFCPEVNLINGKQLLDLYKLKENKNPFGKVYIDFGVQVNGKPDTNPTQARFLLNNYKQNGIDNKGIVVPHFSQLELVADNKSGLLFKLRNGAKQDDLVLASDFPFGNYVGKNGLFRAVLDGDGDWFAGGDGLAGSYVYGRVVCYNAEGVAPKKIGVQSDLISRLDSEFSKKF